MFDFPPLAHRACWGYSQGQVAAADPFELARVHGMDEWMSPGRGDIGALAAHNFVDMGRAIADRTERFDAVYRRCMQDIGHVPMR